MKHIEKPTETPIFFEIWKTENKADLRSKKPKQLTHEAKRLWKRFNTTTEKEKVKVALLKEQGYICCYCQKTIANNDTTQIEHLKSRENYPINSLDYDNFLASCDGGQIENTNRDKSIPSYPEFCGKNKRNRELSITPLQPDCSSYFQYQLDFIINTDAKSITVSDTEIAAEVIAVLNLNVEKLKNNRYQAVLALILNNPFEDLNPDYSNLKTKNELSLELNNLVNPTTNEFIKNGNSYLAYCQISHQVITEIIKTVYPSPIPT